MNLSRAVACFALLLAVAAADARDASAEVISLSLMSGEDPLDADGVVTPREVLDATLEFRVNGGGKRLVLNVSNQTDLADDPLLAAPFNAADNPNNAYFVVSLFFNATEDIAGLTMTSATRTNIDGSTEAVTDWTMATDQAAGNFGTFDFALSGDTVNPTLLPGTSLEFVFDIQAAATVLKPAAEIKAEDFISLSTNERAFVAAKFTWAPEDNANATIDPTNAAEAAAALEAWGDPTSPDFDAAFGATGGPIVPEPDAALLFAAGALVAGLALRRRSERGAHLA